jgi:peptidoglycan/xylan/chitin deacetylase (PgdA/CDA1 family)
MQIKHVLGQSLRQILAIRNVCPLLDMLLQKKVFCLMLHRIAEKDARRLSPNENMKVSREYLERFIIDAKSRGYSFISLSDLKSSVDKGVMPLMSIVMTLDDGYKDNLTNGFPIFKRHEIPFSIYLSTYFVENRAVPWWYTLEELLLCSDNILYMENDYLIDSPTLKENMFLEIRQDALDGNTEAGSALIDGLCKDNKFDIGSVYTEDLFLNWPEVKFLSDNEVEIGNHGHSHINLCKCDEKSIKDDFANAETLIYEHINKKTMHYSYPYGLFDQKALDVLQSCGVGTAVTTKTGIFSDKMPLLQIPRFMLCENMSIDDLRVEAAFRLLREMF